MSTAKGGVLGALLAIALACLVVNVRFGAILHAPDHHLYNTDGDGLRCYFNTLWHVRNDSTALEFTGMNHPFGEHINFPDAQPLVAQVLRCWPGDPPVVALLDLLVLLSWVLCSWAVFRLLFRLGVAWWYAAICSVLIAFLAPQVLRPTQAHNALAYSCVIPLAWLGVLRFRESAKPWLSAPGLCAVVLLWLGIHVYLGFIVALIFLGCGLFIAADRSRSAVQRYGLLLAPTIALVVFQCWLWATDHHGARTEHPIGFFLYLTSFSTLFSPPEVCVSPLYHALFGDVGAQNREGWNYLGLGTELCALIVLALPVIMVFRSSWRTRIANLYRALFPRHMLPIMLVAVVLLLFSFGLPFTAGPEKALWYIPVLRQFRAPGRFAWVFWFVAAIWVIRCCHVLWVSGRGSRWRVGTGALMAVVPVLFAYEADNNTRYASMSMSSEPNVFDPQQLNDEQRGLVHAARQHHARAILPLPWFHNGGEELMVPVDPPGLFNGVMLAWHTRTPLLASSMTRTSLAETRELIQGFGPAWYDRPLEERFQRTDTFLVLTTGTALGAVDAALLGRCGTPFYRNGTTALYTLTAAELFASSRNARFAGFASQRDTLHQERGVLSTKSNGVLLYDDFSGSPSPHAHSLGGALGAWKTSYTVLADLPLDRMDTVTDYIASFWYYDHGPQRCHAFVAVDQIDTIQHRGWWDQYTDPRFCRTIVGDWSLVELPFRLKAGIQRARLFVRGEPFYHDSIWIDDVLIRRADADAYRVLREGPDGPQELFYNNHIIDRP